MTTTPVTWLDAATANSITAGTQSGARIIQLANGNLLVVWTDDDTGAGPAAGTDLVARLFDPLGQPIGASFQMNGFADDNESGVSLHALPAGGFVAAYADADDLNGAATNATQIRLQFYTADGTPTALLTAASDASASAPNVRQPGVAAASDSSTLIAWIEDDATGSLKYRIANPLAWQLASEQTLLTETGAIAGFDIAVLAAGTYAIATASTPTGGDQRITVAIVDAAGTVLTAPTMVAGTDANTDADFAPSITALSGGGFVIAWTRDDGADPLIVYRVFDASGSDTGGGSLGSPGAGVSDAQLIALGDGGFLVTYTDATTGDLTAQRYDASGLAVAGAFVFNTAAGSDVSATEMADGRVALTWSEGGDIRLELLDTRDSANGAAVYTPTGYQVGTIGDDTLTGDAAAGVVDSYDGNDLVTAGTGGQAIALGDGDDTLAVIGGIDGDSFDGGAGTDVLDFSASSLAGGAFRLDVGLIQSLAGGPFELVSGFETLIATGLADRVDTGWGATTIEGGAGNDTLVSATGGSDRLDGGDDNDRLVSGDDAGTDTLLGGAGNDTLVHDGLGAAITDGGAGDDWLVVNTPATGDSHDGGADTDTLDLVSWAGSGVAIDFSTGSATVDGASFTGFENILDGAGSNMVTGDAGANLIDGTEGRDTLSGLGGDDTLIIGGDNSSLDGGEGDDLLIIGSGTAEVTGGLGDDVFELIDGTGPYFGNIRGDEGYDIIRLRGTGLFDLDAQILDLFFIEEIHFAAGDTPGDTTVAIGAQEVAFNEIVETAVFRGNPDANSTETIEIRMNAVTVIDFTGFQFVDWDPGREWVYIFGDDQSEGITGTIINDIISGGVGFDVIDGADGDDTIEGGANADTLTGGAGMDVLSYAGSTLAVIVDLALSTATGGDATGDVVSGFEGAEGSAFADSLTGAATDTILRGGDGDDTLTDDSGADTVDGGTGADLIDTGVGRDVITGGDGEDTINAGEGFDTIDGGAGDDSILAGNGADVITGGDGNDTVLGEDKNDTIDGGEGNDSLDGGNGDDSVQGGGGDDFVLSGAGNDTLEGNDGADTLLSETGNDLLFGGLGDDLLNGGNNADTLDGGDGEDRVFGGAGEDSLIGGAGNDTLVGGESESADTLEGGEGDDILLGQEGEDLLLGEGGNDRLSGGSQSDWLVGGDGNDILLGGGGFDTMEGGAGNDTYTGAGQADLFVFSGAFGTDIITDFAATSDAEKIDLQGVSAITDITDLITSHLTQVGLDAVIDDGLGNTITLQNVDIADLGDLDFLFAAPPELPASNEADGWSGLG